MTQEAKLALLAAALREIRRIKEAESLRAGRGLSKK